MSTFDSSGASALAAISSRPGAWDVERFLSDDPAAPWLLVEVPHGATRMADYERCRSLVDGPLPDRLEELFFVNTDAGAPEAAVELARQLATPDGGVRATASVLVLRSLIPRTFADCNRERTAVGEAASAAAVTPAIPEYIRNAEDRQRLSALHASYHVAADTIFDAICGRGGLAVLLHTYAPRAIQVETFDEGIVGALRRSYQPEAYARWPRRPPVDLITESVEGERLAPEAVVAELLAGYRTTGTEARENASYRLDRLTVGYRRASQFPDRVLCVELRRDLLFEEWQPFAENVADARRVKAMVAPLVAALRRALAGR